MAEAKLEMSIGSLAFAGEGTEQWVSAQLQIFLSKLDSLPIGVLKNRDADSSDKGVEGGSSKPTGSLATYLREKNVGSSQVNRFLAAAAWLQLGGSKSIKTSEVTKALAEAHQQRLGNAADALNQNVSKGFCVKQGEGFYVTTEGIDSLK